MRKASGDVVSLRCGCTADGVWMQLVAEPRTARGNRPHRPDVHVPPDATEIPPPPGLESNAPADTGHSSSHDTPGPTTA
jgi:hypothetical protein